MLEAPIPMLEDLTLASALNRFPLLLSDGRPPQLGSGLAGLLSEPGQDRVPVAGDPLDVGPGLLQDPLEVRVQRLVAHLLLEAQQLGGEVKTDKRHLVDAVVRSIEHIKDIFNCVHKCAVQINLYYMFK